MGTKTATETPILTPEQRLAADKAAFDAAVAKTKADEGRGPAPVAEKAPEVEPKPAPKPKAKPKQPDPAMEALRAEIAELKAKIPQPKPEPEEDDVLEPFRAKLAERFGNEEADDLLEIIEATNRPLREQVKQLQGILKNATEQGRANISKANQRRLSAVHPQLKNKAAWDVLHAAVLADFEKNPKAFESVEDAYDAKASAIYGEPEAEEEVESEEEAPDDVEEAASRIAASAMTAPGRTKRESRTREEKERELHAYIMKHPEDKQGHKRLSRELGLRP